YPNPFNNTTSISYYLPNDGYITLEIYDYLGKKIFTLADGNFGVGKHTEFWNGTDNNGIAVPSGIYFVKLKSEQTTITGKMLLLK
ncbi:T9SS type A sorting domain-containing protein, partial [bacterium]|nr:T9SS type A sorting domain-containing protein [bacterium]